MKLWLRYTIPLFRKTIFLSLLVSALEICSGSSLAWTSPVLPKLSSNSSSINPLKDPINKDQAAWISSILVIGLFISTPFSFICDRISRKTILILVSFPFIISYLILASTHNIILYYFARCTLGIAMGIAWIIVPIYINEMSDDSNRGFLITTTSIFNNFGTLLAYSLGPYLSVMNFNFALASIPALFLIIFAIFGRETPFFLVKNQQIHKVKKILQDTKNIPESNLQEHIEIIEKKLKEFEQTDNTKFMDIFKSKKNLKCIGIILALTTSKQMSGSPIFMFYAQDIFSNVGVIIPAEFYPIITGIVSFLSSLVAPFFQDCLGRKLLLSVSFIGMGLGNVALGGYFYLQSCGFVQTVQKLEYLPVVCVIGYTFFKSIGVGALMWTITCELFPPNLHPHALGIFTVASQATIFASTHSFKYAIDELGKGETFWFYGGWCGAATVFIFWYLPETKGKTVLEVRNEL